MLDCPCPTGPASTGEADGPRPRSRLADFRDCHAGASVVVCGCGESLRLLERPERFVTIGVNDVGRRFTPDYLVVLNPPSQFAGDRFRHVAASRARALFTQLADLPVPHPRKVVFPLGTYAGTDFSIPDRLHYTQNSPYVAVCLAVHMGARRIGLLGVDFTDEYFFGRSGTHPLACRLDLISQQYARLAAACRARGVELVNLSPASRLMGLPHASLEAFAAGPAAPAPEPAARARRVFFVHHRFLSCGDVFSEGLRHAAEDLGLTWADAGWDDPGLRVRVERFAPDLLFVVHGRSFVKRWGRAFSGLRSAVWLLDEPYEVDDTSAYARAFDHVFVNDPATLARHHQARHLPVCYDPRVHFTRSGPRRHAVGFVGGGNAAREHMLRALARRGLLAYVVGGPWKDAALRRLCLSGNIPAAQTAELYRETRIVVNVFRDVHHFNRDRVAAVSLNPRVYEALACGALVVSERRPEIEALVPELPTFAGEEELVRLVEDLLGDPDRFEAVRSACAERLRGGTYRERLRTVMEETTAEPTGQDVPKSEAVPAAVPGDEWELCTPVDCVASSGDIVLRREPDGGPGAERGLVSRAAYAAIDLSFEVFIPPGASFIAKVHQADKLDQTTNSYHLWCHGSGAYVARHDRIFRWVDVPRGRWERLRIVCGEGVLSLFRADRLLCRVRDDRLSSGYAFLGLKGGEVRLREVRVGSGAPADAPPAVAPGWQVLHERPPGLRPRVSIVTTVYDRTDCLHRCIRSVKGLTYRDYEHLIVSDAPPAEVVEEILRIVRAEDDGRIAYLNLTDRFNNWGIAPATVGLRQSCGEFVSFLSDDNGYLPDHLSTLLAVLDRDPRLGFAYSSCLYDGRTVLRYPVPRPGAIDLGQPLFRRDLFSQHLGDDLPFNVIAWDWAMIDAFLKRGVRWKHVDKPSFVFRLARYPQLLPASS